MFKNILIVAVALSLPLKGQTSDLHINLAAKTQEVMAPKVKALTLKEVNDMIVNDQVDLQISYENLLQAQKKIGQARASYFPYGLGTVAAMYFLNIWSPILLVELVTSLPSKIYNVQSEKNMSMAQQYSNIALRENIRNQVAHLYYGILKEESALKLANLEITLLETLHSTTMERVRVGLSTEPELASIELRLLDLRDICLKFSGYLNEEKAAFNTLIAKMPTAEKFELQTVGTYLNPADYGLSSESIKLNALDRSPEIVAADYMVTAARRSKSSARWSVLSFSGIGFGYWGRVKVAGSKIEQAQLMREQVEVTLANQSFITNSAFHNSLDHAQSEKMMFEDTALFYESELARFNANDIALDRLVENGILFVKDYRELVIAHYDSLVKLDDLERIALGDVKGSDSDLSLFEVKLTSTGSNKYALTVESDVEISSVEYIFNSESLSTIQITNKATDFGVYLKLSNSNISGHVNVTLSNGKIITKNFIF